jgi:hypothetical protein
MTVTGLARAALAFVFAALVLTLTADRATAAIWLRFTPATGSPGTRVKARTIDASMSLIPSGRLAVFLAPARVADSIKSPTDSRLISIGELVADEAHVGHLAFVVPELRVGAYMTVAHCKPCGDTMFTTGPFTVTPKQPQWLKARERQTLRSMFGGAEPLRTHYLWYPRKIAVVWEFDHFVNCLRCSHPPGTRTGGKVIRVSFDRVTLT